MAENDASFDCSGQKDFFPAPFSMCYILSNVLFI